MRSLKLTVNGTPVVREVADNRLLVDFLREDLKLTGTKESCDVGVCGVCTVLLDGNPKIGEGGHLDRGCCRSGVSAKARHELIVDELRLAAMPREQRQRLIKACWETVQTTGFSSIRNQRQGVLPKWQRVEVGPCQVGRRGDGW